MSNSVPWGSGAGLANVRAWHGRSLGRPIIYLDAIQVEARSQGHVRTYAVYLALALTLEGSKELLGLWVGEADGAKFWLSVLTELSNRGVEDIILIAPIDGRKGFPEMIESVFPKTQVQICIVYLVRGSLRFVSWKERKAVARDSRSHLPGTLVIGTLSQGADQMGSQRPCPAPIIQFAI